MRIYRDVELVESLGVGVQDGTSRHQVGTKFILGFENVGKLLIFCKEERTIGKWILSFS